MNAVVKHSVNHAQRPARKLTKPVQCVGMKVLLCFVFVNRQINRLIQSLEVFCTNKKQGCDWLGELQNITSHLSDCLLQMVFLLQ